MKAFLRFGYLPLLIALFNIGTATSTAGNIHLKTTATEVKLKQNSAQQLRFTCVLADIDFTEIKTSEGTFGLLQAAGFGNRNIPGEPALPVYHKLIEVPLSAEFSINILSQHYQDIDLKSSGLDFPVFPAQPPLSKSDDPDNVPFVFNKAYYNTNQFTGDDLAGITPVGIMRAVNLARVDISPVQYNPVTGILRVFDELEIEIVFENADYSATEALKLSKASPYYKSMYALVENYRGPGPAEGLITEAPPTYVIVSDPMFEEALQPFIQWKIKKGFNVIEGYTDDASVGTTTTSIKAYLQGLYNSPPTGFSAPSFVLFVGDVAQIPAWSGTAGSHYTDLRYCEYTGDNIPEVFYGRFSATSLAELQPQIDKTLEYEQYLMPDPSFLNEVVMAAGADSGHETHSNGQINYGTDTYFNAAHNITSHTYLQPEPSGGNYASNIHTNVSNGVAYANYTAHCSSSGWADPSFLISDIPNLSNQSKYCLMVGNCCLSAKYDVSSFAEEMLRASGKGAVGYIGGSNSTYWDEDYWWGCGFKSVVLNPTYDADHIGAYDGAFHDHGEAISDWFVTQGQMVTCGDFAVEESGSSLKTYYWEIYNLSGDPSLMIYYSEPDALAASYQSTLMIGMSALTVNTEAYATVALSSGGVLLDAKVADAGGIATLGFDPLSAPGELDIVITKQNRQPHTGTIEVIPAEGPYVTYSGNTYLDPEPSGNGNGEPDYGESAQLSIALSNVGVDPAVNVNATLSTSDTYITITDNTAAYGTIAPDATITVAGGFSLDVAGNIPDQHVVSFTLSATDGTDTWNSNFNLTANAPALAIGTMLVDDSGPGCNNDGILDPGETANLVIACSNTGHSPVENAACTLEITGGTSPFLTLNSTSYTIGDLGTGSSVNAVFSVTADASTPAGTPVDLDVSFTAGSASQYVAEAVREVIIGLIPEFPMANGSITACTGYFYDSGGPDATYSNSESITETIYPASAGMMTRLNFTTFSTESGYDYLYIYNGTNTSATLIGTYNGTTGPGTVTANNSSGALTLVFTSDGSVTRDGWVAEISCYSQTSPPVAGFSASSTSPAVNSTVVFTDLSQNGPTSWEWTFDPDDITFVNGTNAGSQNPEVLFDQLGTYSVSLTVTNAYGSDTEVKTNYLTVSTCTYCSTSYSNTSDDYISNVTVSTINNSSGSTTYSDFSAVSSEVTAGQSYPVSVSVTVNGSWIQHCFVWVDWNNNCSFTDTGEVLDLGQTPGTSGTHILSGTLLVPATATEGAHRMRIAERYNTDPGPCDVTTYGEAEDYTLIIAPTVKTLNLSVLLESLYNGSGTMRKAMGETGEQYPGNTADQITVELHNAANYALIEHTEPYVNLNTNGLASLELPASLGSSYYVTIKHRNSISTTSKLPVSFSNAVINVNFDTPSAAYGDNMLMMIDGYCVIYCGDVNQDGSVDTGDMTPVDNDAGSFATGYIATDINGDGTVDTGDMTIIDNNAAGFVGSATP